MMNDHTSLIHFKTIAENQTVTLEEAFSVCLAANDIESLYLYSSFEHVILHT